MIRSCVENAAGHQRAPCEAWSVGPVDFDLHGIVGIRLVGASSADVSAVTRQLGPIRRPLDRRPDIVIRFVPRLEVGSSLRLLGVDEAGYSDDAFLVMRSKHKTRARVQIPFERIGEGGEVVCEQGVPAVPLLTAMVNLAALSRGVVALHASAFTYRGTGVLVTGWAKGGKTETLLGFMARGAEYVGDEWIYLAEDGRRMYGIPEPIRLWDRQLDELPQYRRRLARKQAARLRMLKLATKTLDRAATSRWTRRLLPLDVMSRLVPLLERQRYVQVAPHEFFHGATGSLQARPDKLVLVLSHDSPRMTVERIGAQEIVERIVFSLQEERKELVSKYRMFRFAFPERSNGLIERAAELERERLGRFWAGRGAYLVKHPYPPSPVDLFETMEPLFQQGGR